MLSSRSTVTTSFREASLNTCPFRLHSKRFMCSSQCEFGRLDQSVERQVDGVHEHVQVTGRLNRHGHHSSQHPPSTAKRRTVCRLQPLQYSRHHEHAGTGMREDRCQFAFVLYRMFCSCLRSCEAFHRVSARAETSCVQWCHLAESGCTASVRIWSCIASAQRQENSSEQSR